MAFYHCQILNSLAHVVANYTTNEPAELNVDFRTGDFSPGASFASAALLATGAQGTTLSATATAPFNTVVVVSAAGMAIEDNIFVELDDGTRYWAEILNIVTNTITLSRTITTSDATSGNQSATDTQLEGTTDFSLVEDFKFPKLSEILGNTVHLRTARLDYNSFDFSPTDALLGDVSAYLASGRDASEFQINSDTGLTYSFVDEDDLADFTYQFSAYFSSNLLDGQDSLVDALWDTDNTQVAVDLIVDNRTPTLPTLTAPYLPFARFTDDTKENITITTTPSTNLGGYLVNDSSSNLRMGMFYDETVNTGALAFFTAGPIVDLIVTNVFGNSATIATSTSPMTITSAEGMVITGGNGGTAREASISAIAVSGADPTVGIEGGAGAKEIAINAQNDGVLDMDGGTVTIDSQDTLDFTSGAAVPTGPSEGVMTFTATPDSGTGPSLTIAPYSLGRGVTLFGGTGGISTFSGGQVSLTGDNGAINITTTDVNSSIDFFSSNNTQRIMRWRNVGEDVEMAVFVTDNTVEGGITSSYASLAMYADALDSNMFFKFTAGGNTGWQAVAFDDVRTETASGTIGLNADFIQIDATAATRDLDLPDATSVPTGKKYAFKLTAQGGAFYGSITPFAGDSIDGLTTERRLGNVGDIYEIIKTADTSWQTCLSQRRVRAEMSLVGSSFTQSIGTTPVVITAWTTNINSTNGIVTADQTNNRFTIDHVEDTSAGDRYFISVNISYEFPASNLLTFEVYVGGVATGIRSIQKGLGNSNDQLTTSLLGDFTTTATGDIDIRGTSDAAGQTAEWWMASVNMVRV